MFSILILICALSFQSIWLYVRLIFFYILVEKFLISLKKSHIRWFDSLIYLSGLPRNVFITSSEPKAQVSYCHSAPSVHLSVVVVLRRRPVSVNIFTFSTSSPELLDGFWSNLVGMKYSWSLTSVVVFRPDRKNRSRGGPLWRLFGLSHFCVFFTQFL